MGAREKRLEFRGVQRFRQSLGENRTSVAILGDAPSNNIGIASFGEQNRNGAVTVANRDGLRFRR